MGDGGWWRMFGCAIGHRLLKLFLFLFVMEVVWNLFC